MTTLSLIADWSGPFASVDEAGAKAKEFDLGEVLYLASGKQAYQRHTGLQYVGISNDPKSRLSRQHHKLPEVKRNFAIWIGGISSHGIGRRSTTTNYASHSTAVEIAEWTLVYFLELPLNTRKRNRPPPEGVILINRWFKQDFATRRARRGHPDWPDFIEYEPEYQVARFQWFGAPGYTRLSGDDILALAIKPIERRG